MSKNTETSQRRNMQMRGLLPYIVKSAFCSLMLSCLPGGINQGIAAEVQVPVATDSRIKTFVYSENDVYNIVTHYGYQSNIEFGINEEVETISVGDRVPFQIIPAGRRLFIRAMLANARTNMTVITNKHAYQFDLMSVPAPVTPNEELVYVVRFFYPGDKKNAAVAYSDGVAAAGKVAMMQPMSANKSMYNYKYTFSGSNEIVPLKIFDDGKSTYFKLRSAGGAAPSIFSVDGEGKESPLQAYNNGEYWIVNGLSSRFAIREGDYAVTVYNEKPAL